MFLDSNITNSYFRKITGIKTERLNILIINMKKIFSCGYSIIVVIKFKINKISVKTPNLLI